MGGSATPHIQYCTGRCSCSHQRPVGEYGGTCVDFDRIVEFIRKVNPHVAAIQEAFGNLPRLAHALQWPYYDTRLMDGSPHFTDLVTPPSRRLQLVSKLPLLDPPARLPSE